MSGSAGDQPAAVRRPGAAAVPPRIAVLVGLALLALLLGACSSGAGTPSTLPATTTASSPTVSTVSPSPSASSDEAQIEAAVRSYYEAMDQAVRTGETAAFESVTAADCPCRQFAESVKAKFKEGELVGAGVAVSAINVRKASSSRAVAGVTYATTPYQEIAADGSSRSFPGSRVQSSLVLVRATPGWVVSAERVLERS